MCVQYVSARVLPALVCARVSTALRSSAIAGSDSPAMQNAWIDFKAVPRTHTHILGDAHRLGQYGCAHEKKNVSYTYEHVFCIPSGKLQQILCISSM